MDIDLTNIYFSTAKGQASLFKIISGGRKEKEKKTNISERPQENVWLHPRNMENI